MKKANIFYYSPSLPATDSSLFVSTPPLYLNSYLKIYHPELAAKISWKKLHFLHLTQKDLIDRINQLDIDILCITLYIWNNQQILSQLKNIKSFITKDIKIIVGGPSTEIVRNKNFLKENPDIDFAVYSQGEQAFADILNHIFGIKKLSLLSSKNVAWKDNGLTKIADFEFKRLETVSPYTNSKELIKQIVQDRDYDEWSFVVPYETSRGCPYNCSFCDWTSGLTHKTYFRKFNIEEELDFFAQQGITNFHLSDANFGQTKQDLEVALTWVKLKQTKGYNFKIHNTNFAKLQKNRVFEIVDILLKGNLLDNLKFAVQDTHEEILNNIERPDIPWSEHKIYLEKINKSYPTANFGIELIQGLPGQTRETWENNFINIEPFRPIIYPWTILPNSPAGYDNLYKEKMKIKFISSNLPFLNGTTVDHNAMSETVVETYSYNMEDYAYFTLLSQIFIDFRFCNIFLNKDRTTIINMIKTNSGLANAISDVQAGITSSNLQLIKNCLLVFVKQVMKENIKQFTKNDVKQILGK